jgi:hypothetical protein
VYPLNKKSAVVEQTNSKTTKLNQIIPPYENKSNLTLKKFTISFQCHNSLNRFCGEGGMVLDSSFEKQLSVPEIV